MSNSGSSEAVRRRAPVAKEVCALARAVAEIGDRWSLLILREAFYGVMRYDDMREDLAIPRSVLTDRLGKLVGFGLLDRRAYQEAGDRRRYGYVLTDKGRGLALSFVALTQWSEEHILHAPGPIGIVEKTTGKTLEAVLVDEDGTVVSVDQAMTQVRADEGGADA